ncbi:GntR family transcriptional regulator [Ovoidimarina sediminis]|uniref:GntR family transcriptional regulator n=1 Tax=Ovoidimarina sediminis TaxID=3079856 RepID=UPI002908F09C|nr:GntR family transcriptional regulator [Rhodophyticola sp. MJ-SS7]MDU8942068.1 GntR family transcriptional regulator [Rhodophyticola sp. MJ-SS7]
MRIETPDIYRDLRDKLVTARLSPGVKLKPGELQGAYGCSANTVRDVLLRLSKVGLVEFEMQRGFRARATSPEQRHDVTRFRILLEQEGAALSMKHGGVAWEAQLSAAHHALSHIETQIARSGDVDPLMSHWSDAEWTFHKVLISGCGSPLLRETYESIYLQFRQQMVSQERDFGSNYFRAIIIEHQAILDAALSRDTEACRKAVYDHLKRNLRPEE